MAVIVNGDGILTGISSLATSLTDITSGRGTVTGVATVGTLQLGAGVSISSPRSQQAAIFTNNTEFFTVDDAGRVGVGTITPNSDAHPENEKKINVGFITAKSIAGDIDARNVVVAGISTFVGNVNLGDGTKLGIGGSPDVDLHIKSAAPTIRFTDTDTNRFSQIYAIDGNLRFDADNNNAQADTNIIFRTDNTERLRIISTGEVGINVTPSNGQMLAITGRSGYDDVVQVTAVGTNIGARINLTNTGTGVARINATNNSLELQTGGNNRLRILSSGEISMGGFAPTASAGVLQIAGGLRVAGSASASDTTSPYIYRTSGVDNLNFATSGVERLRIESGGDMRFNNADSIIHTSADTSRLRLFGGSSNTVSNGAALTLHGVSHSSGNYADLAAATGGHIQFRVGTSEKLRILSSGGITFNGDTAAANALNDYEEGTVTFASTNGGVTFDSSYKGRYTKIGELVTVSGYLVFSSVTNSGTALRVQMPFTSAANSEGYYTRGVGAVFYKYINTPTNQPNLVAYVGGGENYMRFYSSGDNTDWHQTDHNQVGTSTLIYFNICYTTTS